MVTNIAIRPIEGLGHIQLASFIILHLEHLLEWAKCLHVFLAGNN